MDNWTRVDIFTTSAGVEPVSASLLELGINGFEITDAHDLEDFLAGRSGHWDYYDEALLKLRDAETRITLYLAAGEPGDKTLAALRQELGRLKSMDAAGEWGRLECALADVREEDWASSWKQYYHATKVGDRLVVCPSWEAYEPKAREVVVRLDPGMAFGTGTHESTRLCMQLMEKRLKPHARVLDLGCGSGILAISAVLLGAQSALGVDIDEVAVRVANENAAINGVADRCRFARDSLGNRINGKYGLVFANIVADVLIEYAHHITSNLGDYGVLIVSGIIDTRENDVVAALGRAGLGILERRADGGWIALACQRQRI